MSGFPGVPKSFINLPGIPKNLLSNEPKSPKVLYSLIMLFPILVPFSVILFAVIGEQLAQGAFYTASLFFSAFVYQSFFTAFNPKFESNLPMNQRLCYYVDIPYFTRNNRFHNHASSTFVLMFTFAYLCTPMRMYSKYNVALMLILVLFILVDIVYKIMFSCTGGMGVFTGIVCGGLCGMFSWLIAHNVIKSDSNIFINKIVDNQLCNLDTVEQVCEIMDS